MKKSILISLASILFGAGAFAQGSLSEFTGVFDSYGFTVGAGQQTSSANDYFTGNVDIELLYSSSATGGTVTTLNALDGTANGSTALATAEGDGFSVVSTTTVTGSTTGFADGQLFAIVSGELSGSDAQEIGLAAPVPTSGTGIIAMYAVVVGGPDAGDNGLIAWGNQAYGGNPTLAQPGITAPVDADAAGLNLDMVAPAASPEPTTLAFAGLGGLSMLLLRRRNS